VPAKGPAEKISGSKGATGEAAVLDVSAPADRARLANEQAALRRVATLVATGTPSSEVFAAVANEVGRLLNLPLFTVARFAPDQEIAIVVGALGNHPQQAGVSVSLEQPSAAGLVRTTGRPARIDGPRKITGAGGSMTVTGTAAAPIIVDGRIWGAIAAGTDAPAGLSQGAEEQLTQFTELVATAIANSDAQTEVTRVLTEQAALRRLATLVAHGGSPDEVFMAVAREISNVLGLPLTFMAKYGPDSTATVVGAVGDHPRQVGDEFTLDEISVSSLVKAHGRPARIDNYADIVSSAAEIAQSAGVGSAVAAPLIVQGQVWGVIAAAARSGDPLPVGMEDRLAQFTDLVATAISNVQTRAELQLLAEEHAAVRRVAVLVAGGAEEAKIFQCVCEEAARLFDASTSNLVLWRNGARITKAGWSLRGVHVRPGTRMEIEPDSLDGRVYATAGPSRIDRYADETGKVAAMLRGNGIQSQVAAPVIVDGEVWGVLIVGTDRSEPLASGAEVRLAAFTELIATAVSNAAAKAELLASRARIVEAADEQRRRVVRDLHDGAQQRLVHTVLTLQQALASDPDPPVDKFVQQALDHADQAIVELRDLAQGIHPAILSHRGLAAAVEGLADRAPLPVDVDIADERFAIRVESAAYFVAAEALTNIAKYAKAAKARISTDTNDGDLTLTVEDDGVGGAHVAPGRGLSGLIDRVSALDGTLQVISAKGAGTTVRAVIPLTGPSM
jgi:signal transduction histidine kinase